MGDLTGRLRRRLRALTARPRLERELDDEVRTHIEMQTEENVRRGLAPDEARRAAVLAFGGVERVKEECRDSWGVRFLETFVQDVRYGLRGLRRSPGFAAAVVLTLALGIGANTAVFSVVHAVLLRPLPYARGDQVVVLRQADAPAGVEDLGFSVAEVKDYRSMTRSLDDVVEYHSMNFTLLGGAEAQRVRAGVVSGTFFDVLHVKPLLGRTFRPSDEDHAADAALVLSYEFWQRTGGEMGIVGRRFEMNDRVHTVVGVLPPIPQYPDENDVYMPASACPFRNRPATVENRRARLLNAFGRVRSGTSLEEARAELALVGQRLKSAHPDAFNAGSDPQTRATPLKEDLVREARPTFLVLLATVALVLLIACANVANLALARLAERGRELAIRSALGAGRTRLLRQLLTESVVLSLAGGAAGLLLAVAARDSLAVFAARFTPRAAEIQIDGMVLAFTLGCALITGVLAGTLPGLPSPRRLQVALTDESGRTTSGKGRQRLRAGLVVWQLGLSFMLLIGAALMLRSFAKLQAVDGGFRTDDVLTMSVHLNFSTYSNDQRQVDREKVLGFHRGLEERVRSLPGVLAVGHAFSVPLDTTFQNNGSFRIEGRGDQGPFPRATYIGTSHEYFTALAVPVLRGRGFGPDDGVTGPQVALVSQGLARRHFKDADAVGQRISGDGRTWRAIVGVVGDVRQAGLDREPVEAIYVPFPEFPGYSSSLFVRTAMDPIGAATRVQSFLRDLDPQVAVSNVRTLEQVKQESLSSPRLTTSLLAVFAAVALAITAAGLSGLVAYSVSQRTHEIGIRMALGADRRAILRMVLREGLTPVMVGLGIGLLGALVLSRFVGGLLFGLAPTDPLCFAGSALVLTLVAVAACLLPARRATAIHPLVALRAL